MTDNAYNPDFSAELGTAQYAQAVFLGALSTGLSVTGAGTQAETPRRTLYNWRAADPVFAAAWDDAVEAGADVLEDEARRRAVEGVEEPALYMGRIVKDEQGNMLTVKKYSDTLMVLLLKGRRPNVYRERVSQEINANVNAKVEHSADAGFIEIVGALECVGRAKAEGAVVTGSVDQDGTA